MNVVYTLTTLAALGAAAALTSGCGDAQHTWVAADPSSTPSVAAQRTERSTPDSCTLLSATEAEAYIGKLTTPPFRANDDGVVDAAGEACAYRGAGAQQLIIARTGQGSARGGSDCE